MCEWADEFICFNSLVERQLAAKKNFPKAFNGITCIADGKHFRLRWFSRNSAEQLYNVKYNRAHYISHKVKPSKPYLAMQVIF